MRVVLVGREKFGVREKLHQGAVFFLGLAFLLVLENALGKGGCLEVAVAEGRDHEPGGEGIDCLGADTVEPHGKLEDFGIVFGAGVDHRDAFHHLAERNAAAVIAHPAAAVFGYGDVDPLAAAHDKFIDRVIQDLFEKDVDTVIGMRAVAEPADVHARPFADMLQGTQGFDLGFVVLVFSHAYRGKVGG